MFSFRFTCVRLTVMEERYPWCLLIHVLSLIIAACVIALWPRALMHSQAEFAEYAVDERLAHLPPRVALYGSYPSWTRVLTTIGVVVVVPYGAHRQSGSLTVRKTNPTLHQCLAAGYPHARSPSTWSFIREISGDTTMSLRSATTSGT